MHVIGNEYLKIFSGESLISESFVQMNATTYGSEIVVVYTPGREF